MPTPISRRTILRGIGAAVSLPWLEAMGPLTSWAADTAPAKAAPNRMAFLYVPNGKNMADWTPATEGKDFSLPAILEPLTAVKDELLVLTGLTADKARPHGDGGGDHARALGSFLTGAQPRKTDGTDIRAGISVDQVAASRVGERTRLPSLEIGGEHGAMAGNCDSGYSCVYSSTMSWRSATQPLPKEVNPKLVFERLFGSNQDAGRAQRDARRKSVLDFVREDSGDLARRLGSSDQRKLDEYFSAIRDIEQRIERAAHLPEIQKPDFPQPAGVPGDFGEHLRLMCDLLALAFQADVTRVGTFVLANEGSNKSYPTIGVSEGHHELSHHGNDQKKKEKNPRHQPLPRDAVGLFADEAQVDSGGGRHAAGSLHDRVWQRQFGRQRAQPRRPPHPCRRPRLRHARHRPPHPLPQRNAAQQSVAVAAGSHGSQAGYARRQHGDVIGIGWLKSNNRTLPKWN